MEKWFEGYPHFYQKFPIETKFGSSEIYVINKELSFEKQPDIIKVEDGDWRKWRELKLEKYY